MIEHYYILTLEPLRLSNTCIFPTIRRDLSVLFTKGYQSEPIRRTGVVWIELQLVNQDFCAYQKRSSRCHSQPMWEEEGRHHVLIILEWGAERAHLPF